MKRKSSIAVLLVFAGSLLGGWLACADAQAQAPLRVGAVLAVSGPAAFLGEPERKAIVLLQEQINAAGGINGRPLEVVIYDSEGDPTKAVTATKRLIELDNVLAIVGPSTTGEALAAYPLAERAKVVMVSGVGSSALTHPVKPWVFRPVVGNDVVVTKVLEHMKKLGHGKVATVTPAIAYGEDARTEFVAAAPKFGVQVVAQETYRTADTDMTAQLLRVKASGANAILSWNVHPSSALLVKNVKQLGLDVAVYHTHGWSSPRYLQLAGPASNGNLVPSPKVNLPDALAANDPQRALILRFRDQFRSKHNEDVEYFAGVGYDTLLVVVESMRRGATDRQQIRDGIEKLRGLVGLTGVFNFSAQDHSGLSVDSLIMLRGQDGKFVLAE
ncbi:MAG: ABC transporter substrate-binding protein [Candidatus Rokubacteria bacterium]|nr:ABC transporter substrate-binding protein [Candidatus Rokubacteria bacterium]